MKALLLGTSVLLVAISALILIGADGSAYIKSGPASLLAWLALGHSIVVDVAILKNTLFRN